MENGYDILLSEKGNLYYLILILLKKEFKNILGSICKRIEKRLEGFIINF